MGKDQGCFQERKKLIAPVKKVEPCVRARLCESTQHRNFTFVKEKTISNQLEEKHLFQRSFVSHFLLRDVAEKRFSYKTKTFKRDEDQENA